MINLLFNNILTYNYYSNIINKQLLPFYDIIIEECNIFKYNIITNFDNTIQYLYENNNDIFNIF